MELLISATPLFEEEGKVRGAIAAMVDISHRKSAAEQQGLLLHELQHRVKNILATMTALAARMLKTSATKEEFSEGFLARLSAMGRTHDLLSHRSWEGADLRALIVAALPYATADKRNIELAGPGVLLRPTAAAALGMVFRRRADTSRCRGRSRSMPKAGGCR